MLTNAHRTQCYQTVAAQFRRDAELYRWEIEVFKNDRTKNQQTTHNTPRAQIEKPLRVGALWSQDDSRKHMFYPSFHLGLESPPPFKRTKQLRRVNLFCLGDVWFRNQPPPKKSSKRLLVVVLCSACAPQQGLDSSRAPSPKLRGLVRANNPFRVRLLLCSPKHLSVTP